MCSPSTIALYASTRILSRATSRVRQSRSLALLFVGRRRHGCHRQVPQSARPVVLLFYGRSDSHQQRVRQADVCLHRAFAARPLPVHEARRCRPHRRLQQIALERELASSALHRPASDLSARGCLQPHQCSVAYLWCYATVGPWLRAPRLHVA